MKLTVWAAALASVIALGGCTSQAPGEPSGTSLPTTTTPNPVPLVADPLDADPFINRPCDLLPRTWTDKQGFENGEPKDPEATLSGPACVWRAPVGSETAEGKVHVIILTQPRDVGMGGVRGLYEGSRTGQYDFFELTSVDGYPAAFVDAADQRDQGSTRLAVGVEDDLAIVIITDQFEREPQRSEPLAKAAAKQILKTLKAEQ